MSMTRQERERVAKLFDRLAQLENTARERDAEAAIAEGLRKAPHATYALVQTVLIQEEALERANERIRELEAGSDDAAPAGSGGFLDNLRGAFGGNAGTPHRVSVPSPLGNRPLGTPQGFRQNAARGQQEPARGGSFLGQAASIAAGVVVGSMVVDALRGQFGDKAAGESGAQQQASNETGSGQDSAADQYETADLDTGGDFGGGDFGGGGDFS
jgi:hypothetical protein